MAGWRLSSRSTSSSTGEELASEQPLLVSYVPPCPPADYK
jgi:hypothetical protein